MTATDTDRSPVRTIFDGVLRVIRGQRDRRIRASWRVIIATGLLAPPSEVVAVGVVGLLGLAGPLPIGIVQASFIAVVLLGWARFVDRRPLADYGFSAAASWWLDLVVGFVAVLVGFGAWLAIGTGLGWAEVGLAVGATPGAIAVGLGSLLVAIALNAGVQETVFTGLVIKNGAEGLASRGLTPARAVVGAWLVGAVLFAWIHNPSAPLQVATLVIGLGLYGLLYVLTGELALPIGVHTGVNYAGAVLVGSGGPGGQAVSPFSVSNSLSGVLGSLNDLAIPQLLIAYVLLLGWLQLRRGGVGIETRLADWTER